MILFYLNVIVSLAFIYFLYINGTQSVTTFLFDKSIVTLPLYALLAVIFIIGEIFATFAAFGLSKKYSTQKQKVSQNKYVEKISVDKESAELRVQVLEEKVKTLETALQKALDTKHN